MDMRLSSVQRHFAQLYGRRNMFVNGSFHSRALHMSRRIGRLADSERKREPIEGRLASAFSYFMSVVNYFNREVDLARGMANKFPSYGCGYCGAKPCQCFAHTRSEHKKPDLDIAQLEWNIEKWQQHLLEVYGEKNTERGFWEIHTRLQSEFGELSILQAHGPNTPLLPSVMIAECEGEAADVLSWLFAIAYIKRVNLSTAILERYQVCPGCKKEICDCPLVFISSDGHTFSTVGTTQHTFEPNKENL